MIYLVQSDTTAGFVSSDQSRLNTIKGRELNKPCVITACDFFALKSLARVPQKYKNLVRRAKKTSFIYKNSLCVRVVKDPSHATWLKNTFASGWAFSTSANEHGKGFCLFWAKSKADEVLNESELKEGKGSKILKLSPSKIKKLR